VHGVVCNSGALSNDWALKDFYPTGDIPSGVFLTGYSGDARDLPQAVLHEFLDAVAAGTATMPIAKIYSLEQIAEAHADMEANRVAGKLVVSLA
jgi:NADPH:quinone reductase-like Zn-dependent oxidoreductase